MRKDFVQGRTKDRRKDHTGLMSQPGKRCGVEDEEKSLGTSRHECPEDDL